MIKSIVFDLWNTLAYEEGMNPFVEIKKKTGAKSIRQIEEAIMERRFPSTENMMEHLCESLKIDYSPTFIRELSTTFEAGIKNAVLFNDTIGSLKKLKSEGYLLGLISNTEEPAIDYLNKKYPSLFGLFDTTIFSYDAGVLKPGREIFELALKNLSSRPEEAIMVGDTYSSDIEPALSLGMKAVLIKRGGEYLLSYTETKDYKDTITGLAQLGSYLS